MAVAQGLIHHPAPGGGGDGGRDGERKASRRFRSGAEPEATLQRYVLCYKLVD